jgi:putative addiction module killer protein
MSRRLVGLLSFILSSIGVCVVATEIPSEPYEYRLGVVSCETAQGYMLVVVRDVPSVLPALNMHLWESKNELKAAFGVTVFPFKKFLSDAFPAGHSIVLHVYDDELIGLLLTELENLFNTSDASVFLNNVCITGSPAIVEKVERHFISIKVRKAPILTDELAPDDESDYSSDDEPDEHNYVCMSDFKRWISYLKNSDPKAYGLACKFMDDYAAGRFSDVKKLNDYIYEYKQFTKKNGFRMYFFKTTGETGDIVYLLDGGSKIGQQSDIDQATRRAREIMNEPVVKKSKTDSE